METTKNKLSPEQQKFFRRLGNYLDTKIYYYGSVQRLDFFGKDSDIDVFIFSSNLDETKAKLLSFLGEKKEKAKNVIKKYKQNVFKGFKISHTDKKTNVRAEITVYPENCKEPILKMQNKVKDNLPFFICWALYILKIMYYTLGILSTDSFKYCKTFVLKYNKDNDEEDDWLII